MDIKYVLTRYQFKVGETLPMMLKVGIKLDSELRITGQARCILTN
jgi:hypothetical protein